ncbi:MAG: PilZ domain-containing protein [Nannocystaceae bacterium]
MNPAAEGRYHPRLRIRASADVIGSEVVLSRILEDLSLGGCKFRGPAWEDRGTRVTMVLSFPELAATLPIHGVVVRASRSELAIRFHDLSQQQFESLRGHLQACEPRVLH